MDASLEHLTIELGGVSIHAAAAGPPEGRLLILLHGYPEFWYGWRSQIGPLADAGFRAVAPDQRGYNLSSKPEGWRAYELKHLAGDVFGIAMSLGHERFLLAGHDWGGIVAWSCAMADPSRVERLAILNAPHPAVFKSYILAHPGQMLRSWYMLFMQLPWLPEALFKAGNFRVMTETLARTSRPGTFSEENFEAYREAWRQPGAPSAMINWYRALRAGWRWSPGKPAIDLPVKILWGARERFLALELAELSLKQCRNGQLTLLPKAGHWLQHEEPAVVSQELIEFFMQS